MFQYKLILRFYTIGKFLHFVAAMAFILALVSAIKLVTLSHEPEAIYWLVWLVGLVVFAPMSVLAELDAYSRFQNYKQLKDQIFLNGYQERLLKPLTRSSCQREAAILACEELGLGQKSKSYFYARGYRWYHVIPDFVFKQPMFFFSLYFWRTTFFTPYYVSKINYDQFDLTQIDFISKGLQIESSI